MKYIREYWVVIIAVSLVVGVYIKLSYGTFDLMPVTISEVVNDAVIDTKYYVRDARYPIADIVSNLLISFSFALLISLVFIRSIEASDKEKFEKKLLQFQKETARDAISSSFERLIDKDFFEVIKAEILNAKFQRHDIRWQYDIERNESNNSMVLTRTISYILKNISHVEQIEHLNVSSLTNDHCSIETVAVKCKMHGENSFTNLIMDDESENGTFKNTNKKVHVPGCETAEVVLIFKQQFPRDYIYETHFLNHGGVGLELTVNIPKGYDFSVNPTVLDSRTEAHIDEDTKKVFRIKGAIFSGQGIEFMCFKKSSA